MKSELMLDLLSEVKEVLEDGNFKVLNQNKRTMLQNQFNKVINFEYSEAGGYVFLMSESSFKSFEYYLGMEYETPESKIIINGEVMVIYDYNCNRAEELFNLLEECE